MFCKRKVDEKSRKVQARKGGLNIIEVPLTQFEIALFAHHQSMYNRDSMRYENFILPTSIFIQNI